MQVAAVEDAGLLERVEIGDMARPTLESNQSSARNCCMEPLRSMLTILRWGELQDKAGFDPLSLHLDVRKDALI